MIQMDYPRYLKELESCNLCEWRCAVNRLAGGRGVCRVGLPEIAYSDLAPKLKSYSITLLGCCFRCIYCNAYRLSQYPDAGWFYRGYVEPHDVALETVQRLKSIVGQSLGANRISFTGGEPTIHMPYIEEVVRELRNLDPAIGVGVATNGFCTVETLGRVIETSTFITLEIKAYDDEVNRALTGAPSEPVLRNAEILVKKAREKLRLFRSVVIPGITDLQIPKIAEFIKSLDSSIPYRLIGFRPNFVLYYHPGPSDHVMKKLVEKCRKIGLENVDWSGYYPTDLSSRIREGTTRRTDLFYHSPEAKLAAAYLTAAGCLKHPRSCGSCGSRDRCPACLMEPWALDFQEHPAE